MAQNLGPAQSQPAHAKAHSPGAEGGGRGPAARVCWELERKVTESPRPWPQRPCLLPTAGQCLAVGPALAALPAQCPGRSPAFSVKPPGPVLGLEGRVAGPSLTPSCSHRGRGPSRLPVRPLWRKWAALLACQMCPRASSWLWVESQSWVRKGVAEAEPRDRCCWHSRPGRWGWELSCGRPSGGAGSTQRPTRRAAWRWDLGVSFVPRGLGLGGVFGVWCRPVPMWGCGDAGVRPWWGRPRAPQVPGCPRLQSHLLGARVLERFLLPAGARLRDHTPSVDGVKAAVLQGCSPTSFQSSVPHVGVTGSALGPGGVWVHAALTLRP